MKRCDLHIHTIPTNLEKNFTYNEDILIDYVKHTKLDVIAITNHNLFDKDQFLEIKGALPDIVVLPGIEVSLEKGHILVIANNNDDSLIEFNKKCLQITDLIKAKEDEISYEKFVEIFDDLNKYLLIPHYEKKPKLNNDVINKLGKNVVAGEVSSVKKFIYAKKENSGLTPVYFSDFRVEASFDSNNYPVSHTFIDVSDVNINSLKLSLADKTKVSLNTEDGVELFQIFPNGQMLSTGLNIMFGKRSTGKTYNLNAIDQCFQGKAKYIKQFELLSVPRNDSAQFEEGLKKELENYVEEYLKEFRYVIEDILKTSSNTEDEKKIENYLDNVMSCAQETRNNDVFSSSKLFNETCFCLHINKDIEKLINAIQALLENTHYKPVIDRHLQERSLRALLKELIEQYRKERAIHSYCKQVNNILQLVKDSLQLKSAVTQIPTIDLYNYFINKKKREIFKEVATGIKKNKIITTEGIGKFKICVSTRPFKNATDLKTVVANQVSLVSVFAKYDNPIQYLEELQKVAIESSRFYKLFVAINYDVMNSSGQNASGGERAEFNFLQKIKDANLFDILIIDEPESSFDNIFLKEEVNKVIKEIAEKMPVIISTHNSTIGGSIKPNYILYTEKKIDETGKPVFRLYSGKPTEKFLKDVDDNSIKNYEITLNSLEAGEDAYSERKGMYEILKN